MINRSFHSSIGCSPYLLAFDRVDRFPGDFEFKVTPAAGTPYTQAEVAQRRDKMKKQYDMRKCKLIREFEVGQKILVQADQTKDHKGPYVVEKIVRKDGLVKSI